MRPSENRWFHGLVSCILLITIKDVANNFVSPLILIAYGAWPESRIPKVRILSSKIDFARRDILHKDWLNSWGSELVIWRTLRNYWLRKGRQGAQKYLSLSTQLIEINYFLDRSCSSLVCLFNNNSFEVCIKYFANFPIFFCVGVFCDGLTLEKSPIY